MENPFEAPVFKPRSERSLEFRGKQIATADLADGKGYVSLRSLCEAFGLDSRAQRKRLSRQQGYFAPYTATILLNTPGGAQPALCLMASAVPLFLTGVELERVQDEQARELLTAFLDEAHTVLAEHFGISERGELQFLRESVGRMVAEQETFEEELSKKVEAELAELRKSHDEKVQQIRGAFGDLRKQVTQIEAVAGPKVRLNPEQLGQLRQAVATLGTLMQEQGIPKPYPGIYMDITRLSGVSRSEDIRQEDFQMVVDFLEGQVRALTRKSAPASSSTQTSGS
ncbi:protein containg P22_AR N-terminal domain [Longilinea arvoryzae]|uniref:Protein containg P22_AR N-terminal domain n=1 Tax=Longilinea arvoryzae TaxID=360412 RepID=A0A0K8MYG5_9CHLR|nr:phage antirepressor N-terminal domain-containing protein [Longilinea arvoryzae]GAP16081.1 protein containg P22_AR N-terminal domain [Longilinea arvoryzae]